MDETNSMASKHSLPDPLIGEEIIRISLESSGVYIHLNKSQIQIGSIFLVRRTGHGGGEISPNRKIGDVSALWQSLGSRIISVIWGQDLVLRTDDGTEIVVPPSSTGYRGSILSFDGQNTTWDDF